MSRSSSYHQLLPRTLPYHLRAGRPAPAAAAAAAHLYDEDSASDFEADLLANPYQPPAAALARHSLKGNVTGALPFYDPKAAEFNQYLLEQQDLASAADQPQQASGLTGWSGDEEDFFGSSSHMGAGNLTRSRSCAMLNKQGAKQQSKYGAGSSKKASAGTDQQAAAKLAGSSWEPSGSGSGGAGRSTIN